MALQLGGNKIRAEMRPLGVEIDCPREQHIVWHRGCVPSALVALVAAGAVTTGDIVKH